MNTDTFSNRLRTARRNAGMTQADLARRIGYACSQENLSKLERNGSGSELTPLLAAALGVDALWLMTGAEPVRDESGKLMLPQIAPSAEARRLMELIKLMNEDQIAALLAVAEQFALMKPDRRKRGKKKTDSRQVYAVRMGSAWPQSRRRQRAPAKAARTAPAGD